MKFAFRSSSEAEAGKPSQDVQEGFLQNIQGGIAIACKPKGQRGDPIPIAEVQGFKRGCVATIDGGN